MALVQIGKNHDNDIKKLKGRLKKIEKHKASSHATIKLKVEDTKDVSLNSTIAQLKKKIKSLENKQKSKKKVVKKTVKKKTVKKKTAKKVIKKKAKSKLKKSSIEKHKHDLKKIQEKLSKLERKKRNAVIKPTLNFKSSITKLNKRITTLLDLLEKAHEDFGGDGNDEHPLIKKLNLILEQNEKIAQGILTVAEIIRDKDKVEVKETQEENVEDSIIDSDNQVTEQVSQFDQTQQTDESILNPFDLDQSAQVENVTDDNQSNPVSASEGEDPFQPVNVTSQDTNITQVNNFAGMDATPIPDFQKSQELNSGSSNDSNQNQGNLPNQQPPSDLFNPNNIPNPNIENSNNNDDSLFNNDSSEELNELFTPPKDDTIEPIQPSEMNVANEQSSNNVNNNPFNFNNKPMDAPPTPNMQPMDAPPPIPNIQSTDTLPPTPNMQPMDVPPQTAQNIQPQFQPNMATNEQQPKSQDNIQKSISNLLNSGDLNSKMPPPTVILPENETVTPIQSNTAPIPPSINNEKIQLKPFNNNG